MKTPDAPVKPWYREPWPWFLASLPATSVVAGLTSFWIAAESADGLVVGDYYKAGLAINQTLARDDTAYAQRIVATLAGDGDTLTINLEGRMASYPDALNLTIAHPTRQGYDKALSLTHVGNGHYRTTMPTLASGKWQLQLTDAAGTWRLAGELFTPFIKPTRFAATETAAQ